MPLLSRVKLYWLAENLARTTLSTEDTRRSLWLHPASTPIEVPLSRFQHYHGFIHTLDQFVDIALPGDILVKWGTFEEFPAQILTDNDAEAERENEFIDEVAEKIRKGEDVPPLVYSGGFAFDGRHRAIAARQLGIHRAPQIDITPYWRK